VILPLLSSLGSLSGILPEAVSAIRATGAEAPTSFSPLGFLSMTLLLAMVAGKGGSGPYREDGRPDPCASLEGTILSRHPDGRGREIELSKGQEVNGDDFAKNARLTFDADGLLSEALLPRKQRIQGFLCAAKGPVVLEKDREGITGSRMTSVVFHKNGRIQRFALGENQMIEDIPLKAGTVVHRREDGRLHSLFLASAQVILGLRLSAQTSINFHTNGAIAALHFLEPQKQIDGFPGFAGKFLSFHENGKVKRGQLCVDQVIQGVKYSKDTWVEFDENSNLLL
jgi:hypothetical protein